MHEIKVWAQMFFKDGSLTQGKYTDRKIYKNQEDIDMMAIEFLESMNRTEGIMLIWGDGKAHIYRAKFIDVDGFQEFRLKRL